MAGLLLQVKKEQLDRLSTATSAILNTEKQKGNGYNIHLPNEVPKLKQPTIRLQESSPDSSHDLALTLILQTAEHHTNDAIKQPIDDGVVSISFE